MSRIIALKGHSLVNCTATFAFVKEVRLCRSKYLSSGGFGWILLLQATFSSKSTRDTSKRMGNEWDEAAARGR